MEYKKCEFCGEQVHIRSKKCPFCENVLSEDPIVVEEEEQTVEQTTEQALDEAASENPEMPVEETNQAQQTATEPKFSVMVGSEEPKDYIYKAEVRHSVEYTKPLSNWVKTFLAAFCVVPFFGQIIGAFFGVYYSAHEDVDRRSYGSSLITLSILVFLFYVMEFRYIFSMPEFQSIYNSLMQ